MAIRQPLELNEPPRREPGWNELRQHLINASNELYLYDLLCLKQGQECPAALRRAHQAIRSELRRLEKRGAELGCGGLATDEPGAGGGPDA